MLDSYQLQLFLAVVEAGSFTAAAEQLHLTQPAISRQMRLLQEHLGVRLFRRVGRRLFPTYAGDRLVEAARQLQSLSRQAEEEMAMLQGEAAGILRVGGSGAPAWHVLSRLLPAFRREFPAIGFQLDALPPGGAAQALREEQLDLVVQEEALRERGLECDLLAGIETVLVVPPDEEWQRRKRLPLRKLGDIALILPSTGTPARRFLDELLGGREITLSALKPALEVSDPGAVLPLVTAGLGAALLPRSLVETAPAPLHQVTLWPGFSWPLYLIHRAGEAGRLEDLFCRFALEKGGTARGSD